MKAMNKDLRCSLRTGRKWHVHGKWEGLKNERKDVAVYSDFPGANRKQYSRHCCQMQRTKVKTGSNCKLPVKCWLCKIC